MNGDAFKCLMATLDQLEDAGIDYTLSRIREDSIMVLAAAPGQHWEIEVMGDGSTEIEVFQSDGTISDERRLSELLGYYADRAAAPSNGPGPGAVRQGPQSDGLALESADSAG